MIDCWQRPVRRISFRWCWSGSRMTSGEDAPRDVTLIWASNEGLSETELAEMTGSSRLKLSPLVIALDYHLVRTDGLLGFFHDYLRRAVEKRYLADESRKKQRHMELAGYYEVLLKNSSSQPASSAPLSRAHPRSPPHPLLVQLLMAVERGGGDRASQGGDQSPRSHGVLRLGREAVHAARLLADGGGNEADGEKL